MDARQSVQTERQLHDCGNRFAHVVDVLAVQSSHAHAASVSAVHTKLRAQAHHLVFAQT